MKDRLKCKMSDPDVCVEKSEPNSLQICQVFRLKTSERSVRSYYVLRDRHDMAFGTLIGLL